MEVAMIRVNDKYVIEVDSLNYTAQIDTKKKDKEGNPVRKTIGYYSNIANAMKGIAENEVGEVLADGEYSLKEAIAEVKSIYGEFNHIFDLIVGR